jgi:hypothetical protein
MDNIFVERLWRSLKYEEVYLNAYESVAAAKAGIGAWLSFYNDERQHQSLGYRTPRQIYQDGLWICGRSASPTGCASPASRASSEGGEMLAFAHIPTGATANEGFNIDEVNNRFAEPAVALTATGADIETAGLHLKTRLRLSHKWGPLHNNTRPPSRNLCSYHLHNACEASANSVDAWTVGVSVAVEGIANLVKHEIPIAEKRKINNLTKSIIIQITSLGQFKEFVNRVQNLLGMMYVVRPQDRLKPLERRGYIGKEYIEAWSSLRNRHVHPSEIDLRNMTEIDYHQTVINRIYKATALMYQITFYLIGYKGKFTDYGAVGHRLKDYPFKQ